MHPGGQVSEIHLINETGLGSSIKRLLRCKSVSGSTIHAQGIAKEYAQGIAGAAAIEQSGIDST